MATLLRPRSLGTVRPSASSSINWGNPLTTALRAAFVVGSDFGVQDLVQTMARSAKTSRWSFGESRLGRSVNMVQTTSVNGIDLGLRPDFEFGTDPFSVHVRATAPAQPTSGVRVPTIGRSSTGSNADTNVSWTLNWYAPNGSTIAAELWTGNGVGASAVQSTTTFTAGTAYDLTATRAVNGDLKLYVNGLLDKTASVTVRSIRVTAFSWYLAEARPTIVVPGFSLSHAYVWGRCLSKEEVRSIVAEPFSIVRSFAVSADVQSPPTIVTPAAVVATATVPSATLSTGSTVTPSVVAGVATVPAPLIPTLVEVSAVVATAAVPSSEVTASALVTPAAVSGTATVPDPMVVTPDVNIFAAAVVATATVPSATLSTGSTVTPSVAVATATVPAPSVSTASSAYAIEVSADSPLIYWRLGESSGTNAADASGNGNVGVYQNTPTLGVTGLVGNDADKAMRVSSASLESAKSAATFSDTYGAHSLEVIFKLTGLPTSTPPFSYANLFGIYNNDNAMAIQVQNTSGTFDQDGVILQYYFDPNPGSLDGPTVQLNRTYHVVATHNGSTALLYVNGSLVETQASSGSTALVAANFYAGNDDLNEAAHGVIDECAFYDHVLSPARIAAHYNAMASGNEEDTTSSLRSVPTSFIPIR